MKQAPITNHSNSAKQFYQLHVAGDIAQAKGDYMCILSWASIEHIGTPIGKP